MLPLIDILLRHGVDIRAEPICLHRLVGHRHKSGKLYYLKQLLDAGADPNERWGDQTPLMIAGIKGRRSMARLLLEYGAEPRIKNDEGRTFLDLVADRPSMAQLVKLQKIP